MDFITFKELYFQGICNYNINYELSSIPYDDKEIPTTLLNGVTFSTLNVDQKIIAPDNSETVYEFYMRYYITFDSLSSVVNV